MRIVSCHTYASVGFIGAPTSTSGLGALARQASQTLMTHQEDWHSVIQSSSANAPSVNISTNDKTGKPKSAQTMHSELLNFTGGGLHGSGQVSIPDSSARPPCVMVLGAHPKFGGERKGDVASRLSVALLNAGVATLHLEYGNPNANSATSTGQDAELDYVCAALQAMALHDGLDGSCMGAAGYAFGASIALRAAEAGAPIQAVAAVAPPARALTAAASAEILAHKLLIGAGEDHELPAQQFRFLAGRLSDPVEAHVLWDADHFFTRHGKQLSQIVVDFFERTLTRPGTRRG